ncbi:MAG: M48 family metalloprotease [Phenylobacterium sp.]|uniref:M48 family metalloprotease n=1 Tax=Phenylobacterium sp. TaxID=1871053 RepID=UPI00391DAA13
MAQFDPAAATAAYLAQLPPQVHEKAQAYTQGGHWLSLWGALAAVAIAWLVLRSGVLVRLRAGIERKRPHPWLAVFAVLFVDGVIEAALGLPWTVYADWWRERAYGMTDRAFAGWFVEWALVAVISLVVTVLMLALIYALMRRAPRTWWIWSGGVTAGFFVAVMVLAPVLVLPLLNDYKPAPPGPVRDAIVAMAQANGVPSDKIMIYDGSKQSNRYTANVAGLGGTARIAMSDVMFQKGADMAEIRAVVGHEMGHYVHRHALWMAAAYGLLGLAAFFLVDRLFQPVLRLTGAQGVQGLTDPAGFPVISIIITVLALVSQPITNSIVRIAEADADRFSLERVNEPDGLAQALVKTVEYRAATPSRLEEVLFYDHPAVGRRVRRAMDWKAAHPTPETP